MQRRQQAAVILEAEAICSAIRLAEDIDADNDSADGGKPHSTVVGRRR
jgi:hypothetical protein